MIMYECIYLFYGSFILEMQRDWGNFLQTIPSGAFFNFLKLYFPKNDSLEHYSLRHFNFYIVAFVISLSLMKIVHEIRTVPAIHGIVCWHYKLCIFRNIIYRNCYGCMHFCKHWYSMDMSILCHAILLQPEFCFVSVATRENVVKYR